MRIKNDALNWYKGNSKISYEVGEKYGLLKDETDLYNEYEYRIAEGGRTLFPSRYTTSEIEENITWLNHFHKNEIDKFNKFAKVKSKLNQIEEKSFEKMMIVLVIIVIVIIYLIGYRKILG